MWDKIYFSRAFERNPEHVSSRIAANVISFNSFKQIRSLIFNYAVINILFLLATNK